MPYREEIIGNARLILSDCREVLADLRSGFDAVVTDPPYGISDAALKIGNRVGKRRGGDNVWHADSEWDHAIDPAWPKMCCEVTEIICWFGQWRKREEVAASMSYPLRAEIVWAKDCHAGPPSPVAPRDERIWVFSKAGMKPATFETSVWDQPIIPTWEHKHHKNEKPVALMQRLLAWVGKQTICDPFMGSGSTGVACAKMGLSFTGIEQDPSHFDTACRRLDRAMREPDMFIEPSAPAQQLSFIEPSEAG